jgi:hypothetical protein
MSYARISVTLPESLLIAADQRASELDRPRSWVVAEALRAFLAAPDESLPRQAAASRVREPSVSYGSPLRPGLGPSRLAQLEADLALTPEERVLDAERTARAVPDRPGQAVSRLLVFDRYEDYLDWKRREDITL